MYFLASRAVIPLPLRHRTIPSLVVLLLLLCAVHPSHPVGAGDPYLLNGYALDLLQKGESEKALEQLQKASSLFPYDLTLRRNLAEVYTLIGQRRMESGRFEEAATSFDNARELFPEVQRYTVLRGVAL
jgi:Flp pilus assembly protein TadD